MGNVMPDEEKKEPKKWNIPGTGSKNKYH